MKKHRYGFTIIELLVVIMVIGLLATMGAFEYINQLQRGRDTSRKADLRGISVALEMYRNDPANKGAVAPRYVHYPDTGSVATAVNSVVDTEKLKDTRPTDANIQGYFTNIRKDPLYNPTNRFYRYIISTGGIDFKLSVKLEDDTKSMTNDGGTASSSPDWYEIFSDGGKALNTN